MKTKSILEMSKDEILQLKHKDVRRILAGEETCHIARVLGALWLYDYDALAEGRPGLHAIIKGKEEGKEWHSDGFLNSKVLLASKNMLEIFAYQMALRILEMNVRRMDYVAGVPNGATRLGREVAKILNTSYLHMNKESGNIVCKGNPVQDGRVLLVEDVLKIGTGFSEAVRAIFARQQSVMMLLSVPVIINRGGLEELYVGNWGPFRVISVADIQMQHWHQRECPLCDEGSKPIEPKKTKENWRRITTAQLALNT